MATVACAMCSVCAPVRPLSPDSYADGKHHVRRCVRCRARLVYKTKSRMFSPSFFSSPAISADVFICTVRAETSKTYIRLMSKLMLIRALSSVHSRAAMHQGGRFLSPPRSMYFTPPHANPSRQREVPVKKKKSISFLAFLTDGPLR